MHSFYQWTFFIISFFCIPSLLANQLQLVSTESDPDAFIQNSVNVINGDYCESMIDLVIAGPDPLILQRFYSTKNAITGADTGSWKILPQRFLVLGKDVFGKSCVVGKERFFWTLAFVGERSGGILPYSGWRSVNGTTKDPLKIDLSNSALGMVNTYAKEINGQTNHQNNHIHCKNDTCELILGDGTRRIYQKVQQLPSLFLGEEITISAASRVLDPDYYLLVQETLPSGNHIFFSYDTKERLVSIEMKNKTMNKVFSWIHLSYNFQEEQCIVYIEASDKRTITYHLALQNGVYQLTQVQGSHCIPISYEYNQFLTKKILPEGRFCEVEYENGKVCLLKGPNHQSGQSEVIYSLSYEKGYTEVFDALGIKTKYCYDNRLQLSAIERYDDQNKLYRIEQKFWGQNKTNFGLLLAKTIANSEGNVYSYRSFLYDKSGNVTEERLYGNVTGQEMLLEISTDGKLLNPEGQEHSVKTFSFSSDGFNLITKMGDCKGNQTTYTYQKGTNHLTKTLIFDKEGIKKRIFRSYNEDGSCITIAEDDIPYQDESIIYDSGGKERHITYISPKTEFPGTGLPEVIEEKFLDFKKKQEFLIRKLVNAYDDKGNLLSCSTYDSNGIYAFTKQKNYTILGLVASETDSLDREVYYKYDGVGNQISIFFPDQNKTITTVYNFHNQPTEITHTTLEGEYVICNGYDTIGRKISSKDHFDNYTYYEYDCFHRLTQIIYPEVLDDSGQLARPIFNYTYDLFGNAISIKDPKGFITKKSYNLYGSPTKINYPDGTFELFKYDPEGSLHRSLTREKIITVYEYDFLGRCIHEEVSLASERGVDSYLMTRRRNYSAFRLLSTRENDLVKDYQSDYAGRLISLTEYDSSKGIRSPESRITEFFYDSFNRPYRKKNWFDQGREDYALECFEYDINGNIVEKRIEDANGFILLRRGFSYNSQGLCTEEYSLENGRKTLLIQTDYDSERNPVCYLDGQSQETKISIDNFYQNSQGQTVLKKTLTNPLGVQTEIEFDTLGRIFSISKIDSSGILLSNQKNIYDLVGNKTHEIHDRVVDGQVIDSQKTQWIYGPMGRLEEEIQAVGTILEKRTHYSYNFFGKISKKSLSETDSSIYYFYDKKGNLEKVEAFDKNKEKLISNNYSYNESGNIIRATVLGGKTVQRYYNVFGLVTQERIEEGQFKYHSQYSYDRKGRLKQIILPDGSSIVYIYNAAFGCAINRVSTEGKILYSHTYNQYDEQGNLLNEGHIGYIGSTESVYNTNSQKIASQNDFCNELYKWDSLGRLSEVQGDKQEEYSYNPLSQIISEKKTTTKTYVYDSIDNRIKSSEEDLLYNALNQLTASSLSEFSYDSLGNLIKKTDGNKETLFEHNLLSQLISIINSDKTSIIYSYDVFGRPLSEKRVDTQKQKTLSSSHFFYLGYQEIGTISEKGVIETLKIPGLHGNEISLTCIALEIKGEAYAPIHDISGNIIAVIDPFNRELVESYHYTSFGEETIYTAYGEIKETSVIGNPWRFAGKRVNQKSGLIMFGFRFYDPSLGRWISQDPAGFVDGPNLYSYLHNNSVNHSDFFGLTTEDNLLNKFCNYFYGEVEPHCYCEKHRTCKRGGEIGTIVKNKLPIIRYSNEFEEFHSNYKSIEDFRKNFIFYDEFCPYYEPSKIYDLSALNLPELADLQIGFINGIDNSFECARNSALYLSKLSGGYNIHAVYNATHGALVDLQECKMGLDYVATEPVRQLHKMWNSFFEKSSAKSQFLMICHSQGAIHVRNALLDYPPKLREHILVVAIAPGGYIYQETCAQVIHYRVSKYRDPIPRLDQKGAERSKDFIVELHSNQKSPLLDHNFMSPTYEAELVRLIQNYIKFQGSRL